MDNTLICNKSSGRDVVAVAFQVSAIFQRMKVDFKNLANIDVGSIFEGISTLDRKAQDEIWLAVFKNTQIKFETGLVTDVVVNGVFQYEPTLVELAQGLKAYYEVNLKSFMPGQGLSSFLQGLNKLTAA
jgi:hypothetical protein